MFFAINTINCIFAVLLVNNKLLYVATFDNYFQIFLKKSNKMIDNNALEFKQWTNLLSIILFDFFKI